MKTLKQLLESVFSEKVRQTYEKKLRGKVPFEPSDFDPDALQLGVLYELRKGEKFARALYTAMTKLHKNPHCYDDVDDSGETDAPPLNQVTWTGRPGIFSLG